MTQHAENAPFHSRSRLVAEARKAGHVVSGGDTEITIDSAQTTIRIVHHGAIFAGSEEISTKDAFKRLGLE